MKQLGVLVPVVTPCDKSGKPNVDGVKAVCKYFVESGCHGIFVLGSTGRGPWFDGKDKAKVCSAAKQIASDIPLFGGCSATGLPEMLENAHIMADSGATGVVIAGPCYFDYNETEIEAIFLDFADNSPLPVMIYDIPAFAGAKLNTAMLKRIARHENIIGIKDSSSDWQRFTELICSLGRVNDFYLIQGKENLLAKSILGGASGITVSLTHVEPKLFIALYNAAAEGKADLAEAYQKQATRLLELMNECFKLRPEISTLFHFLNYVLSKRGICENIILAHEGDCPGWLAEKAEEAMQVYEFISQ